MSVVATMNPQLHPIDAENKSKLASVPAWGSYLYQNFLMPAFSPTASMSDWLNTNSPFGLLTPRGQAASQPQQPQPPMDYFGGGWGKKEDAPSLIPPNNYNMPAQASGSTFPNFYPSQSGAPPPTQQSNSHPSFQRNDDAGPSSYYPSSYANYSFDPSSIPTSLLLNQSTHQPSRSKSNPQTQRDRPSQPPSRDSLNIIDGQLTHTPSPILSRDPTPHQSPKQKGKRRFDSLDSNEDNEHDSEHEPDIPEGVERDGVIWGMKVDAYRALSARERKRVRNRISARTFRAKRKEHLVLLEESTSVQELKLRLANEENNRLKLEVVELRQRLSQYE